MVSLKLSIAISSSVTVGESFIPIVSRFQNSSIRGFIGSELSSVSYSFEGRGGNYDIRPGISL